MMMNNSHWKLTLAQPQEVLCSLHNHSTYSDGKHTLREMAQHAKNAGCRLFGISDHYTRHPEAGDVFWSTKFSQLPGYFADLAELKKELEDENFTLLAGLEVDYFTENWNQVKADIEDFPIDYLIGSVHYVGDFALDNSQEDYDGITPERLHFLWQENFRKLTEAAATGDFLFLGHSDLLKKFVGIPDREYLNYARTMLEACRESGTAIELNTSGWRQPCASAYPEPEILTMAKEYGVPVVITADAHLRSHIGEDFTRARALLENLGITPSILRK